MLHLQHRHHQIGWTTLENARLFKVTVIDHSIVVTWMEYSYLAHTTGPLAMQKVWSSSGTSKCALQPHTTQSFMQNYSIPNRRHTGAYQVSIPTFNHTIQDREATLTSSNFMYSFIFFWLNLCPLLSRANQTGMEFIAGHTVSKNHNKATEIS